MALTLRELLEEHGVHHSALAQATGVHEITVYFWLSGRSRPRAHRLRAIADAIGVSVDDVRRALDETERRATAKDG